MNKATRGDINNTRMLTLQEATLYSGLSRNTARKYFDDIGAIRRFGSVIRVDKRVLDKALDSMATGESE